MRAYICVINISYCWFGLVKAPRKWGFLLLYRFRYKDTLSFLFGFWFLVKFRFSSLKFEVSGIIQKSNCRKLKNPTSKSIIAIIFWLLSGFKVLKNLKLSS
jgi:hypothetical protein